MPETDSGGPVEAARASRLLAPSRADNTEKRQAAQRMIVGPATSAEYLARQVDELSRLITQRGEGWRSLEGVRLVLLCLLEEERGRIGTRLNLSRVAAMAQVSQETMRRRYHARFPGKRKHGRISITGDMLPLLMGSALDAP